MSPKNITTRPVTELCEKLGHNFADPKLLEAALTHPSLRVNKRHKNTDVSSYERLEFLGDRVLGLVMAEWLYKIFPNAAEGELAKRHASLVNGEALRVIGIEIGLHHHLHLAHGEEAEKGNRQNLVTLGDAMEALIGAMYLDAGLEVPRTFIHRYWEKTATSETAAPSDPKTGLQEWAQGHGLPLPLYKVIENSGPSHAPRFVIEVTIKDWPSMQAEGPSKRVAEKKAAETLLNYIEKTLSSKEIEQEPK